MCVLRARCPDSQPLWRFSSNSKSIRTAKTVESDWYTQERAKRQALKQDTHFEREFLGLRESIERLVAAASETVKRER